MRFRLLVVAAAAGTDFVDPRHRGGGALLPLGTAGPPVVPLIARLLVAPGLYVCLRRLGSPGDGLADQALDCGHRLAVGRTDEGDGDAGTPGAAGAADAVDVVVGVVGYVEID